MAEFDELIVNVNTISRSGFECSKAISGLNGEFGKATALIKSIEIYTSDVATSLHKLLQRLKQLQTKQDPMHKMREVIDKIVLLCQTDIDGIGEFSRSIQKVAGDHSDVRQKTEWLHTKSKLHMRQSAIDSLRTMLNLLMHTLDFIECGSVE